MSPFVYKCQYDMCVLPWEHLYRCHLVELNHFGQHPNVHHFYGTVEARGYFYKNSFHDLSWPFMTMMLAPKYRHRILFNHVRTFLLDLVWTNGRSGHQCDAVHRSKTKNGSNCSKSKALLTLRNVPTVSSTIIVPGWALHGWNILDYELKWIRVGILGRSKTVWCFHGSEDVNLAKCVFYKN